jgi:hypothetical protein
MRRFNAILASVFVLVPALVAAEKYSGPRPPKPDVPYILQADNLVETEVSTAANETRKDATYAVINGASSPAKTPLAEPAFVIRTEKLIADKIRAYKLESTKTGKREVLINHKKPKNVPRPIYVTVTKLDDKLYRLEIDEPLENGEYALSPDESDLTFNFAIY